MRIIDLINNTNPTRNDVFETAHSAGEGIFSDTQTSFGTISDFVLTEKRADLGNKSVIEVLQSLMSK